MVLRSFGWHWEQCSQPLDASESIVLSTDRSLGDFWAGILKTASSKTVWKPPCQVVGLWHWLPSSNQGNQVYLQNTWIVNSGTSLSWDTLAFNSPCLMLLIYMWWSMICFWYLFSVEYLRCKVFIMPAFISKYFL